MLGRLKALLAAATMTLLPGLAAAQVAGLGLRISGPAIDETLLDLEALDAMPQESFVTDTIWTDGAAQFSGVPLAALLDRIGVEPGEAEMVELVALNDYRIEIPIDEIGDTAPIIATRVDGRVLPVREKGPYWLVYPYDAGAEYRTEAIFARSIWQLAQVNVPH